MKAQDLRIGNLVKCDDELVEIASIYKTYVTINTIETWVIESVKPISLTEEWLVKKIQNIKKDDVMDNIYYLRVNSTLSFSIKIDIFQKAYYINGVCLPFEELYVHQLQNLYFALTGEELNIINE